MRITQDLVVNINGMLNNYDLLFRFFKVQDRTLKRHTSIGVFVVCIDTGNPVHYIPSKSCDLVDENKIVLTEWK
jgi:hypothetical protein